jgi:hypothetical protein
MKDLLPRLLFDVTSKIAFGVDLNTGSNSNSIKDKHPFFTAFDEMNCLIYNRLGDPLYPTLSVDLGLVQRSTLQN